MKTRLSPQGERRISRAEAKDQVQEEVRRIVTALRAGKAVKVRGVGKLVPGHK